jgi:bifunctional non-homologous end joining protein LigD
VPKQGGGTTIYPVVDQPEDMAYLANQNTVTFHMWTSSMENPDHPDWMVIDLDPDEGDIAGVRASTLAIGELTAEFGITGFPLVTGSSGFHVWVPLDGTATTDEVSMASRALAGLASSRHPDQMTVEFLKKERKGRVFVDWLRNGPTATVVVPFSLRPRPTAPVAVPITWDEVGRVVPDQWTLGHIADRLELEIDLTPQKLPIDDVVGVARAEGVDLDSTFDRFGRK